MAQISPPISIPVCPPAQLAGWVTHSDIIYEIGDIDRDREQETRTLSITEDLILRNFEGQGEIVGICRPEADDGFVFSRRAYAALKRRLDEKTISASAFAPSMQASVERYHNDPLLALEDPERDAELCYSLDTLKNDIVWKLEDIDLVRRALKDQSGKQSLFRVSYNLFSKDPNTAPRFYIAKSISGKEMRAAIEFLQAALASDDTDRDVLVRIGLILSKLREVPVAATPAKDESAVILEIAGEFLNAHGTDITNIEKQALESTEQADSWWWSWSWIHWYTLGITAPGYVQLRGTPQNARQQMRRVAIMSVAAGIGNAGYILRKDNIDETNLPTTFAMFSSINRSAMQDNLELIRNQLGRAKVDQKQLDEMDAIIEMAKGFRSEVEHYVPSNGFIRGIRSAVVDNFVTTALLGIMIGRR